MMSKSGRNDPCPCGSGKKYKKCCLKQTAATTINLEWQRLRRTEAELVDRLINFIDNTYDTPIMATAWEEFALGLAENYIEPESEMKALFMPWFLFNWRADPFAETGQIYPESTIAEQYLEKYSNRLSRYEKQFIEEATMQAFSFWSVKDSEPGQWLLLQDILLDREIKVMDRQASQTVKDGAILFARVITINNTSVILGCASYMIAPHYALQIQDFRQQMMRSPLAHSGQDLLQEYDIEIRDLYFAIKESMFTPPEMHNTDGDVIQITRLHYQLDCSVADALEALASLSMESADTLLKHGVYDSDSELQSISFSWLKKGNKSLQGMRNTILGQIKLNPGSIEIEVNSQQRAEAIKRKVKRRLGNRATFLHAVIDNQKTLFEQASNAPADRSEHEELMNIPEVQEQIRKMAQQHWKDWLDTPLPALKGKTPRQAAKTNQGRQQLEVMLAGFEYNQSADNLFAPDIADLRHKLGI